MSKVKPRGTSTSFAIQEVQRYMDETPIGRNDNPLEWWKNHQHLYPNLAHLVKIKCNIKATSVPCERLFFKAENI
ncbi:unnamed protein product [Diabrotica balteata]|uniref:HAT C-terminal dimerisation domain-containing protein n=1 Tax=Diabrotica balteata TaxID=107213 RepID=A0A9N9T5R1_DIABA|nr:unnamed protein product [Diabrotica balteata]